MPWPLSQDYNELIQNPQTSFADAELRGGRAVANKLGIPIPCSGNFADVYEFYGASGSRWAIKCFTRQIPGLRERYREISQHLEKVRLPFMVDFTYLDQGIRVRGDWFPIVKMQWVNGLMLNQFVERNLDQPQVLEFLCQLWVKLAQRLRELNLAHCDLQHGNVLLVPTGPSSGQVLKLVDYDGMCVPALALRNSIEVGHPAYQHPQRLREGIYNLEVDRFSHLVIYTALRSFVAAGRPLWKRYDTGDNLLFRPEDFQAPNDSALFREMLQMPDFEVRRLADALAWAAQQPLDRAPLLTDLALGQRFVHAPPLGTPLRPQAAPANPTPVIPALQGQSIPIASAVAATVATDSPGPENEQERKPRWPMWTAVGSAAGLVGIILGIALIASGTSPKPSEISQKKDAPNVLMDPDPKPKPPPENPSGGAPKQPKATDKPPNLADFFPEIKDEGGFFSAEAIEKANAEVKEFKRNYKKDLVIETYKELPEDKKEAYAKVAKDQKGSARFFDEWGRARAKELELNGVYIAIFKTPPYVVIEVGNETGKKAFTPGNVRRAHLRFVLVDKLNNKKYDDGLSQAIAKVHDMMKDNAKQAAVERSASPHKQSEPNADATQPEPRLSNPNPTDRAESTQDRHKSSTERGTQSRAQPHVKPSSSAPSEAEGEPTSIATVTLENIKRVRAGMTLDQVEQILGKRRKATEDDVREAIKQLEANKKKMEEARKKANAVGSAPEVGLPAMDFKPGTTKYIWGTKNTWLFVDVDDRTQRVVRTAAHSSW
jgi:hypothetical protein